MIEIQLSDDDRLDWALKSFKKKGADEKDPPDDPGNPTVNFHGEKRSNDTHESRTDPDARLARKGHGKEAKLSYSAHALMENRNGLLVGLQVDMADGYAERRSALELLDEHLPGARRITVGADKAYDTQTFVKEVRARGIKPHFARNTTGRRSAIHHITARSKGYAISQQVRKRIEQGFGWSKTIGGLRNLTRRGLDVVKAHVTWTFAVYNLIRIGGIEQWWEPAPT